jgi:hypothetical protein
MRRVVRLSIREIFIGARERGILVDDLTMAVFDLDVVSDGEMWKLPFRSYGPDG